jgi:hypothetical protein
VAIAPQELMQAAITELICPSVNFDLFMVRSFCRTGPLDPGSQQGPEEPVDSHDPAGPQQALGHSGPTLI